MEKHVEISGDVVKSTGPKTTMYVDLINNICRKIQFNKDDNIHKNKAQEIR